MSKPRQQQDELLTASEGPGRTLAKREEPSVALMLQSVIDKGITSENVSALEALVGLYDRMQTKSAEQEFNKAFAKLQSEIPGIEPTRTVPNKDGTLRYKFAPFEEIMDKVKPLLVANGFSVSFNSRFMEGGRMVSICNLRHIGGHSQANEFAVRIGGGPPGATETQADGSAKTYAKRGALCDALNIVVEHDDDARMLGTPIGKALGNDFRLRVEAVGADVEAFLKFGHATGNDFGTIPDERWQMLDDMLKRKEAAKAAREKAEGGKEW